MSERIISESWAILYADSGDVVYDSQRGALMGFTSKAEAKRQMDIFFRKGMLDFRQSPARVKLVEIEEEEK